MFLESVYVHAICVGDICVYGICAWYMCMHVARGLSLNLEFMNSARLADQLNSRNPSVSVAQALR